MTDAVVDFHPASDPLLGNPRLDCVVELPVLGIVTRFESNSAYVIGVVEEAFGGWRSAVVPSAAKDPLFSVARPPRIRIVVHDGLESAPGRAAIRHIAPDAARLIIQSPGSIAISDGDRRESIAYVTTVLAADRDHFREAMLEAATLSLLSNFDRHPLHAAAIACDGRAILLAGASGAGKSTLAHIAHHAGLTVVAEDRVWLQVDGVPSPRVWGWPGYVRLIDGAADSKRVVPLHRADAACYRADEAIVCVLARGSVASLECLPSADVIDALTRDVAPGFDRFPGRHALVARALATPGGWRLTLSADPNDALPLLRRMLSERPR